MQYLIKNCHWHVAHIKLYLVTSVNWKLEDKNKEMPVYSDVLN